MKERGRLPPIVGVAIICGILYWVNHVQTVSRAKHQAEAKAAGFDSYATMEAAAAAGVHDPKMWAERQEKMLDQKAAAEATEIERTRDPATEMLVKRFSWQKGGFGVVGLVTLTIANNNSFAVKDIGITCSFSGASGTELARPSMTIYDMMRPHSVRTFPRENIGFINNQAQRASCWIYTARRR